MIPSILISRRRSAKWLGVGLTLLDELLRSGVIRSVRIHRRRMVIADSLYEYVDALQKKEAATE